MPDVRNCRRCGKIFNYLGGEILCPVCKQQDEEDFKRVKDYLYEYPGATMSQIATDLEISVEKIKRYLRQGRLEIIGNEGNLILECEMCGKSIKSGRYCDICEKELSGNLKSLADKMSRDISQTIDSSGKLKFLYKDTPKKEK